MRFDSIQIHVRKCYLILPSLLNAVVGRTLRCSCVSSMPPVLCQVKIFEEDFQRERSDRERMNEEKEELKQQLEKLQKQLMLANHQVGLQEMHLIPCAEKKMP